MRHESVIIAVTLLVQNLISTTEEDITGDRLLRLKRRSRWRYDLKDPGRAIRREARERRRRRQALSDPSLATIRA
jgi:hypothetical protein